LLDSARTIAGKISLERQPLDLHLAVDQALGAAAGGGQDRARHVDYQGSSVWVSADRTRIEQSLSNLVSNAVKHTPEGGRIALRWQRRAARSCSQSPTRPGMDAETARGLRAFLPVEARAGTGQRGLRHGLTLPRPWPRNAWRTIRIASDGPDWARIATVACT